MRRLRAQGETFSLASGRLRVIVRANYVAPLIESWTRTG
jgi:hypothetical protein